MVYSLAYRRPPHVEIDRLSYASEGKPGSSSEAHSFSHSSSSSGIPDALSFDRVISGGTCPPCTIRDFMNYLVYIEMAAENLQFFLWFKDYSNRFSSLPTGEKALAPKWLFDTTEVESTVYNKPIVSKKVSPETAATFKDTDFAAPKVTVSECTHDPFHTPPTTPDGAMESPAIGSVCGWSDDGFTYRSDKKTFQQTAAGAFESADVILQPFTIQPFRDEISRIIAIYMADGSPRQLNLSAKERALALRALASTTHPSALADIAHTIEWSLRHQAHPNFIRWTICNGNRSRVIFARGLGVAGIMGGIISAIVITLSDAGRGWRVLSTIGFVIGIATLIAAWKGMCVVLHGMHHRHLRPWELFVDEDGASSTFEMKNGSFDSFGGSNSYEDEPWVAKYEKRNIIRKVLDREVWIQEPALRQIQDTIFLQAIIGAVCGSAVVVAIFIAFPKGAYY